MSGSESLQTTYGLAGICHGCGPANPDGLHLNSFVSGDVVVAEWSPAPHGLPRDPERRHHRHLARLSFELDRLVGAVRP